MPDTLPPDTPYAVFSFQGTKVIIMDERQFKQAVADGKLCKCGDCVACRAAEHERDAREAR